MTDRHTPDPERRPLADLFPRLDPEKPQVTQFSQSDAGPRHPRESLAPPQSAGRSTYTGGLDWSLVRAWREAAAKDLSDKLQQQDGLDDTGRRELGRAVILSLLDTHNARELHHGRRGLGDHEHAAYAKALFDSLFGLGRLQPLVDDPEIENIEITGHDGVRLVYADGRLTVGDPIADSDEALIADLGFMATHASTNARTFSPANPRLHLRLPDGSRLAALAWISHRPSVVIRRHRLMDITIADLVDRQMMSPECGQLLTAAVRSNKSVVVSGIQGAGKTTVVRALANELHPEERIGTIETEYELHLHDLGHRHKRIIALEARPGSGERSPDGRMAGEVTLDDLLYDSLRMNLSRIIVGEVRGREVLPMFKAMQAGAGSLSTTHAHSARGAIERLVTCAMEAGSHVTADFAYRQISEHVDLIVHVALEDDVNAMKRRRFVAEVIQVSPGERGLPATSTIYEQGPHGGGHLLHENMPTSFREALQRSGFGGGVRTGAMP